jgi:hypothetical protein
MTKPLIVACALLLAACGADEPAPAPEPAQPPEGRAETQTIRNTEAVGVPGGAIADKVDGALDQTEAAERRRKEEADRQSAEE